MTRDEIIQMARDQGLPETSTEGVFIVNTDDLGRMLAVEREACAKIAEEWSKRPDDVGGYIYRNIRARETQ